MTLLCSYPEARGSKLNFQNHRHDQRALLRLLGDVALQIGADLFLNHSVIGFLFVARDVKRLHDDLLGPVHQPVFAGVEAAGDDFRRGLDHPGQLVDGDDRQHDAVFADMAAVFDDQVLDHFGARAVVDADPAHVDPSHLARAQFGEFKDVATFDQDDLADRAVHGSSHFGVQLELAVLAMDGNEVARLHQVDDELQFFLAGVPADVHRRRRAVLVDDVGLAPEQVIDHAVDGLFIAGNDARGEHDRIAFFNLGVLVIVDGRARQGRHGFALRAADQDADLLRRKVLHFARVNKQALRDLHVAQVFGDFGRGVHGAPDEGDLAAVLPGEFDGKLNAVDGGRETGDEEAALGAGEDFVELTANGAFAGRVAFALDVGRVLQQREHAFLPVFGEGVQIEEAVVGGRRVDFKVARMDHHPERGMNGERHTIHQAVGDLDGMHGERADPDALPGADFAQISVIKQAVLVELVFHIGKRELGAPDGNIEFGKHPGQRADVVFVAMGEHDAAHALAVLGEVGDLGNHDVNAEQFGLWEHEAGVDDQDVVAPAQGHAVHAELAQAAQGDDLQFSGRHSRIDASTGGWQKLATPRAFRSSAPEGQSR